MHVEPVDTGADENGSHSVDEEGKGLENLSERDSCTARVVPAEFLITAGVHAHVNEHADEDDGDVAGSDAPSELVEGAWVTGDRELVAVSRDEEQTHSQ
jgi:hypothetical protein